MKNKKAICSLLAVLLFCTACSGTEDIISDEPEQLTSVTYKESDVTLARYTEEGFSPYMSQSKTNNDLYKLVYQPLFRVDFSFDPSPVLASSYTNSQSTFTIELDSSARFSDGSAITAADVEYSFNLAKASGSVYSERFAEIISYKASGKNQFTVTFAHTGVRQLNLLDIPVIKTDSDKNNNAPIGSGAYYFNFSGGTKLSANAKSSSPPAVQTINLYEIREMDTLYYMMNTGLIHAVRTELDKPNIAYTGNEVKPYASNKLTFLGVNATRSPLSNAAVRRALSLALNRQAIVGNTLNTFATATPLPFHPQWSEVKQAGLRFTEDRQQAKELLDEAGIAAASLKFRILANSENSVRVRVAEEAAAGLRQFGIQVEVQSVDFAVYTSMLQKGDYDLFVGEVRLPDNMDIRPLFAPAVRYSGTDGSAVLNAFDSLGQNDVSLTDVAQAFHENTPLIPLFYIDDALIVNKNIAGSITPSGSFVYHDAGTWRYRIKEDVLPDQEEEQEPIK